jgi:hypothetical protein
MDAVPDFFNLIIKMVDMPTWRLKIPCKVKLCLPGQKGWALIERSDDVVSFLYQASRDKDYARKTLRRCTSGSGSHVQENDSIWEGPIISIKIILY